MELEMKSLGGKRTFLNLLIFEDSLGLSSGVLISSVSDSEHAKPEHDCVLAERALTHMA